MTTSEFPIKMTPGVIGLLPLFYVGWSDSVLSPSEIKLIHGRISRLAFLSAEEKEQLIAWTDPSQPPHRSVFRFWLTEMRRLSKRLSLDDRSSLVKIGLEMAFHSADLEAKEIWHDPETKKSLEDIESALGLSSHESLRLFLSKLGFSDHLETAVVERKLPHDILDVLDRTYTQTRQRVRKLLLDPVFKLEHERDKEVYRDKILSWAKYMAVQGFGAYAYPIEYGGKDDAGSHITVFEMLGYHDLSLAVKFGVQFGLFGSSIYNLGTERHHQKYLPGLGKGDILGCFAMTETGHGSNVKDLETTLVYDHEKRSIIVNSPSYSAGKEYIGNALHCSLAVVFGQLIVNDENQGIHAVVVEVRDGEHRLKPGVRIEDCGYKMGLNGIDNGRLWFDEVVVPVDNLLDRFGSITQQGAYKSSIESSSRRFFTMLGALVAGRVSVAWAGVSAAKKALYIAVKYGLKRRQFSTLPGEKETLILDYPSHQRRLFPFLAKAYVLDAAMKELTADFVASIDHEDKRYVEAKAAGLKALSSWNATKTIQECREACGGKGYLVENQFTDLKNDTDIFSTFEGDNTVLLQLVAKGLLSDMQRQFLDEGYRAVFRYITQRVSTSWDEINPFASRRTDAEYLTDHDVVFHAFTYRERKLLDTVSRRMKSYIGKKVHPSEAFLKCQNHMIELAEAHIERVILKASYRSLRAIDKKEVKTLFVKMHELYALSTIERHKGFYLENDYMEGSQSKAVRRVVNKLCSDLRDHADVLVEGFGIPEELIVAPIALDEI